MENTNLKVKLENGLQLMIEISAKMMIKPVKLSRSQKREVNHLVQIHLQVSHLLIKSNQNRKRDKDMILIFQMTIMIIIIINSRNQK